MKNLHFIMLPTFRQNNNQTLLPTFRYVVKVMEFYDFIENKDNENKSFEIHCI